ncbi:hypothetical protein NMG60_11036860 [Bertholletia excelsa]
MEAVGITIISCVFVIIVVIILIWQCKGRNRKKASQESVRLAGRRRPAISTSKTYSHGASIPVTPSTAGTDNSSAIFLGGAAVAASAAFATMYGGDGGGGSGCDGGGGGGGGGCGGGGGGGFA